MKRTLNTGLAALLGAMLMLLTGCGQGGGSDAPKAGTETPKSNGGTEIQGELKGTIGVSVMTTTNPFFVVIGDSITDEAAKHGYKVIVHDGDKDANKQREQVKDFIVKKVSAIILTPTDSKAIGSAIEEANAAGIPVFTADLACTAPGAKVVSHIATDNYSGGKQAGEAMIEALGETGGKIVVLDFQQAESCVLRVKGFKEVIDAHNAGKETGKIEIVMELPSNASREKGFQVTEDAIQAHPDLAGVFAINDPAALGAYSALEKAGKAKQVKIVGFDGMPAGKQAIKEGKIYADPIQYPERIGRQTVQSIMEHLDGEEVPAEQLIPTGLYRQADGQKDPDLK
jgi:ribose transport system substrate-binding protein